MLDNFAGLCYLSAARTIPSAFVFEDLCTCVLSIANGEHLAKLHLSVVLKRSLCYPMPGHEVHLKSGTNIFLLWSKYILVTCVIIRHF